MLRCEPLRNGPITVPNRTAVTVKPLLRKCRSCLFACLATTRTRLHHELAAVRDRLGTRLTPPPPGRRARARVEMGKGKAKARPAAAEDDSDDALLRAAIAENAAVREKAALESARAQAEQAAREAECAQRDKEGAPLSREASCCLICMHVHRNA